MARDPGSPTVREPAGRQWALRSQRALLAGTVAAALLFLPAQAQPGRSFVDRMEEIWLLVSVRYWPAARLQEVGWEGLRDEFLARAAELASEEEFDRLARELTDRIGDDHTAYVPAWRARFLRPEGESRCAPEAREACAGEPVWSQLFATPGGPAAYLRVADLVRPWAPAWIRESVAGLEVEGAKFIALDLRGNPGGAAVVMAELAGVFTRGVLWRLIGPLPGLLATTGPQATSLPLVVLVDEATNSAAEGLAGGLQRVGRALVAGQVSAGNVETLLPYRLREGGLLLIAEGRLAPLQGPAWDGVGIRPDISLDPDLDLAELMNLLARALAGPG